MGIAVNERRKKKLMVFISLSKLNHILSLLVFRNFPSHPLDGNVPFQPPKTQVFINFGGDQLRKNFIGYLVDALQRSKVNVFADNYLHIGDDLNELFKKIEYSGIAVVVFLSRYCESKWCLEELVKIKELVSQDKVKVIPVFYKVTTTNVKRLKEEFGDNFRDREWEFESDEPKIKRWKDAINYVSHGGNNLWYFFLF
ncbi:unnamed protein product [Eruca vesicaria subsp. sativa]|uniref:TIR domain-containing protein n=1 Tax=Eruca vesicaria subsp. sativa TaxID=29727 RepID=A0ABC8JUJ8_ERUVS|nr:unnamed protein product [Eruca vesicaria subsp. sativa]